MGTFGRRLQDDEFEVCDVADWPGQVEDSLRLVAVNLSFSCSPRPRLCAQGDRPVVAGRVS
jgi:hypothetical protein